MSTSPDLLSPLYFLRFSMSVGIPVSRTHIVLCCDPIQVLRQGTFPGSFGVAESMATRAWVLPAGRHQPD